MEIRTDIEKKDPLDHPPFPYDESGVDDASDGQIINVSGHPQELDRSLGFWSISAISVVMDNAWAAGAGSLVCDVPMTLLFLLNVCWCCGY